MTVAWSVAVERPGGRGGLVNVLSSIATTTTSAAASRLPRIAKRVLTVPRSIRRSTLRGLQRRRRASTMHAAPSQQHQRADAARAAVGARPGRCAPAASPSGTRAGAAMTRREHQRDRRGDQRRAPRRTIEPALNGTCATHEEHGRRDQPGEHARRSRRSGAATSGGIDRQQQDRQDRHPAGASCSGKPASAVAIAAAWTSASGIGSLVAVGVHVAAARARSPRRRRPCRARSAAENEPASTSAKLSCAHGARPGRGSRSRRSPGRAQAVPRDFSRAAAMANVSSRDLRRHPPHASVGVEPSRFVFAGVAPLYFRPSSPPKMLVVPVLDDVGGAEHDAAARRARPRISDVVGVRVVAGVGELDVVGDDRGAGLGQRADDRGVAGAVERELAALPGRDRRVVDRDDARRPAAPAARRADREARVDGRELRRPAAQSVARNEHAGDRGEERRRSEHVRRAASARFMPHRPASRPTTARGRGTTGRPTPRARG